MSPFKRRQLVIDLSLAAACGCSDREPLTNSQIASIAGLSEQRVGNIINGALDKLRLRLSRDPDFKDLFRHDHTQSTKTRRRHS